MSRASGVAPEIEAGGEGTQAAASTQPNKPSRPTNQTGGISARDGTDEAGITTPLDAARVGGRRRRRGRRRAGRAEPASETIAEDLSPSEQPADYLELPVERGLPVLFKAHTPEEVAEEEPERRPGKPKKVSSGKLYWFIRTKSYVPIPEIRRRFEIPPSEVSTIKDNGDTFYIGLPSETAEIVANLRRQQKIGIECSPDFSSKVVIGVFPLRRL